MSIVRWRGSQTPITGFGVVGHGRESTPKAELFFGVMSDQFAAAAIGGVWGVALIGWPHTCRDVTEQSVSGDCVL